MSAEKKEMELEQAFEKLDEMIRTLEHSETSLEDSFNVYQKGMKLLKECNQKIDHVEKKMMVLNDNGELNEF